MRFGKIAPVADPDVLQPPPFLDALLRGRGPSGSEEEATGVWREHARSYASRVHGDRMGNSFAYVPGRGERPRVALLGHIDEIGLAVTNVDEHAALEVCRLGKPDPTHLVGQRVQVRTRDGWLPGVIGRTPIHFLTDEDPGPSVAESLQRAPRMADLRVDIGARTVEEAWSLVEVGDPIVTIAEPLMLRNGRVASRAIDNRLGAYLSADVARRVAEAGGGAGELVAIATVQEESGARGATTASYSVDPDIAVVFEVGFTSDFYNQRPGRVGVGRLGGGPILWRSPTVHPGLVERLRETADRLGIAVQTGTSPDPLGTDADSALTSRGGIACVLLSVAIRYEHSSVELLDLADLEATARLATEFCLGLDTDVELER